MAKKGSRNGKGPRPDEGDRHLTRTFNWRQPDAVREYLREIAEREERDMSVVLLRSFRKYCLDNGYGWPDDLDSCA